MADPLLITVAPNGARKQKADHPALPITPEDLAETAKAAMQAGARMLHLHVRDEAGGHSLAPPHYRAAINAVRRAVADGMIIQTTTEAVGIYTPADQMMAMRQVHPEAASYALREIAQQNVEGEAKAFFHEMAANGTLAQYILYTVSEAERFLELREMGFFPQAKPHALFVLGRHSATGESDPAELDPFLEIWPEDWPWSVCAFGTAERAVMEKAISLGGHVRVGFENNLKTPEGAMLKDNAEQVAAVAAIAERLGRRLATAEEAAGLFR